MRVIAALMLLLLSACTDYEEPKYMSTTSSETVEIRHYKDPMVVADVTLTGDYDTALSDGFKLVAGYIFGGNKTEQKIAMTTPVAYHTHSDGSKTVRFFLPKEHTLETLPAPNDPRVKIHTIAPYKAAVIRFSGRSTQEKFQQKQQELMDYMKTHKLSAAGEPIYAYYNPPWTPWFMRRNEVIIPVAK